MSNRRLIIGLGLVAIAPFAYSLLKEFYLDYRWRKIIEELTEQDEAGQQQRSKRIAPGHMGVGFSKR